MTLFLDRDGTVNRKRPENDYVKSWEEFEFMPDALAGLRRMAASGARMICVTNQRGVARGRMTEDVLMDIHRQMLDAVRAAGGRLTQAREQAMLAKLRARVTARVNRAHPKRP